MSQAAYSLVADDLAGNRIDEWSLTRGGVLVRRPGLILADPQDPDAAMNVTTFGSAEAAPRANLFSDDLYLGIDAGIWDTTGTSAGTATAGSGLLTVSNVATTTGNAYIAAHRWPPNQLSGSASLMSLSLRLPDAGTSNNRRRWGVFTATDGFFFELNATTFRLVTRRNSVDTTVAIASFSENPSFAIDTNFHRWEIEWSSMSVLFTVDGYALHRISISGQAAPLTNTVHLPVRFENVNTGTAGAIVTMELRQCSLGRIGGTVGTLDHPGRNTILLTADTLTAAASDTLLSFNKIVGSTVTAVTATAGYIVPAGKTFRLMAFIGTIHASSAVAQSGMIILRAALGGTLATSTQAYFRIGPQSRTAAVANSAVSFQANIPGGHDFPSGMALTFSGMAETTAGRISFSATGYEY